VTDENYAAAGVVSSRSRSRFPGRPPWVDVLLSLTQADLRVRYRRGRLRVVRWLLEPFALAGVYLVFVAVVLNRPGTAVGLSLACAVVPFQLLITTLTSALGAITSRRSIILNMTFNRFLIPLATTLTELVVFAASFSLIVVMMAIYGVAPTWNVLWFPAVLLVNLLLAASAAYAATLFGIWLRELRAFVVSFVRILFFLAPGLVPLRETTEATRDFLRINPMTGLFEGYRSVFMFGTRPAAWQLLIPLAASAVLLVVFVPIYRSEQRQFAKVI